MNREIESGPFMMADTCAGLHPYSVTSAPRARSTRHNPLAQARCPMPDARCFSVFLATVVS